MLRSTLIALLVILSVSCIDTSGINEAIETCTTVLTNAQNSEISLTPELMELVIALGTNGSSCTNETTTETITEYVEVATVKEVHHCSSMSMCWNSKWSETENRCINTDSGWCGMDKKADVACYSGDSCLLGKLRPDKTCEYWNQCDDKPELLCSVERWEECNDNNPCTIDRCEPFDGSCRYEVIEGCEDVVPEIYLQDRTCRFKLHVGNHVRVYSHDNDDHGGVSYDPANPQPYATHHMTFESPQKGVVGVGYFPGVVDVLDAYSKCFSPKDPINVFVFGDEACSREHLDYPSNLEGVNVAFMHNPFVVGSLQDNFGDMDLNDAIETVILNFDVVVACVGPEMSNSAIMYHFHRFVESDNVDMFMVATEGPESFDNEDHLKTLFELNRYLSKFGLNFGHYEHDVVDLGADYDELHAILKF